MRRLYQRDIWAEAEIKQNSFSISPAYKLKGQTYLSSSFMLKLSLVFKRARQQVLPVQRVS